MLAVLTTGLATAQTKLDVQDTRATPTVPNSYSRSVESHFKETTVLGLSAGNYHTVLGLRGWSDDSGGRAHELAFADDSKIYLRSGFNSTGWGGWRSLLVSDESGNFDVNGNIKLANRANNFTIGYASLSETYSGASTILGNNLIAGSAVNTVKKTISVPDPGTFVSLNYYYGITFHTGVNGALNVDQPVENSEKMRITQSGNVLIGKTQQANANYKLDINGKVRANEIVVNTTGADFVFENGYRLRPIVELEKFVKQNKHLPEIPTAKTMQTEGVGVSELQTKLLQKVEELSLYIIELNKKNEKQEEAIGELKKELEKIKSKK